MVVWYRIVIVHIVYMRGVTFSNLAVGRAKLPNLNHGNLPLARNLADYVHAIRYLKSGQATPTMHYRRFVLVYYLMQSTCRAPSQMRSNCCQHLWYYDCTNADIADIPDILSAAR